MEYHQDRFEDYSLMVFDESTLVAVLPANRKGDVMYSHQGLTYGGLVLAEAVEFKTVLNAFKTLLEYLEEDGTKKLVLKPIPGLYHKQPADEMDYLLFLLKAERIECSLTSCIRMRDRLEMRSSNRRRNLKKAKKNGLMVKEVNHPKVFWEQILIPNLKEKFDVTPVHSLDEMALLTQKFPDNIRHFYAYKNDEVVAGVTVFETDTVAHLQYISTTKAFSGLGGLDIILNELINEIFIDKAYFNFGVSSESQGTQINLGLMAWKESFGARPLSHSVYDIKTKNHKLLADILK